MTKTQPLSIIAGTPDQPLVFEDIEIPCYVLEDETRAVSQRGLASGLKLTPSAAYRWPRPFVTKALTPYISSDLHQILDNPIEFKSTDGGNAHGYPATILIDICEVFRTAYEAGDLREQYSDTLRRCNIIYKALARVGIIALVDEATGYQDIRGKRALAAILEKYLAEEFRPWTKNFPL